MDLGERRHGATDIFQPLREFYARAGEELPEVEIVQPEEMPERDRALLVHDSDMTPVLERQYGEELELKVLDSRQEDVALVREVVLVTKGERRPVEFGAIRIELAPFPESAREEILACRRPLGSILSSLSLNHTSAPSAYFRVRADDVISRAFTLQGTELLFGRCNTLVAGDGARLAAVVEILPPG